MEALFAWFSQTMEWFGRFIPRKVILDGTEGAVKTITGLDWSWGSWPERTVRRVSCSEGAHWYFPWTTKWAEYPVGFQTERLETQTMESKEGVAFLVSGAISFCISDLLKLLPVAPAPQETIKELAATSLHDACTDWTWKELTEMQQKGTLKTQLKKEAKASLRNFGVEVLEFRLHSLARCKVIRLSQSTASEDLSNE